MSLYPIPVMQTVLLYAVTVLIWGTSWFAIKYQLGTVDPLVSIAHRMALAAVFCAVLTQLTQGFVRLSLQNHLRIFFQGLCLFSCNYLFIYAATADLSSGLIAVIFSTMVALNALGGALFLNMPLRAPVVVGGLLGLLGMAALFYPELETLGCSDPRLQALLLCFLGTLCASAGNLVAAGSLRRGLPVLTCNTWGMFYGGCTLYLAALLLDIPIVVDLSRDYLSSLAYLAFFATVLAFWAYVSLIGRIGPDRAAYTTLLFPIVALLVSSVLEGYAWTLWSAAGLSLVLLGNWLAMRGVRS
ncbi:DMT family transporter [Congregibacter litoralis]|uniref:DMT family transporter n=1 Tax=Congregibacter litoralis TaxID=393662 RepID=UPI001EE67E9A|nr:DMT family transporter [Congregibacter litoralis]